MATVSPMICLTSSGAATTLRNDSELTVTVGTSEASTNNLVIPPGSRLLFNVDDAASTAMGDTIAFTISDSGAITADSFGAGNVTTSRIGHYSEHPQGISVCDTGTLTVDSFGAAASGIGYYSDHKSRLKRNLLIRTKTRSKIVNVRVTPAELKARQTLRDFITEREWRRYITNGFIMAVGASGRHYQISADRSHTIVWEKNQKIQELCIRTDESCPPTDHVLTIKAMVELDEKSVWDGANQYGVRNGNNLTELFVESFNHLIAGE